MDRARCGRRLGLVTETLTDVIHLIPANIIILDYINDRLFN